MTSGVFHVVRIASLAALLTGASLVQAEALRRLPPEQQPGLQVRRGSAAGQGAFIAQTLAVAEDKLEKASGL